MMSRTYHPLQKDSGYCLQKQVWFQLPLYASMPNAHHLWTQIILIAYAYWQHGKYCSAFPPISCTGCFIVRVNGSWQIYSVWPKVSNQHGGNVENLKPKSTTKIIGFDTKMKESYFERSALCTKLFTNYKWMKWMWNKFTIYHLLQLDRPHGLLPVSTSVTRSDSSCR